MHGCRVPEGVGRDTTLTEALALAGGCMHGPPQAVGDGRPRERPASFGWEQRLVWSSIDLREPPADLNRRRGPDGNGSVLTVFPVKVDVWTALQSDIDNLYADCLRYASPRVVESSQQYSVALSRPRRGIRRIENSLDLFSGEKSDQGLATAFQRNRERALNHRERLRVLEGGETQEGADSRQPGVPAVDGVLPDLLQVIKKRQHKWGVQIGEHEAVRGRLPMIPGKHEEQPEAITIGRHGLRAGVTLPDETVQEELFNQSGKTAFRAGCLHWESPDEKPENRSDAVLINSGVAEMYQ